MVSILRWLFNPLTPIKAEKIADILLKFRGNALFYGSFKEEYSQFVPNIKCSETVNISEQKRIAIAIH